MTSSGVDFTTKLSLPKFIAVRRSLTPKQEKLLFDIGQSTLLDLCLDEIPRSLVVWVVRHFNVTNNMVELPNGFSFMFNCFCVNKVLGTAIGGRPIPSKCSENFRDVIRTQTGCAGQTPSINELIEFLKTDLCDEDFQRYWMMFNITSFLCPTTYECASPDYLSAIEGPPEEIPSYDWSYAVFIKLSRSIDIFIRNGCTGALGGCLIVPVMTYLDYLNTRARELSMVVPRISVWDNETVKAYELIDLISEEDGTYGNIPLKDIRDTPFHQSVVPTLYFEGLHPGVENLLCSFVQPEKHRWAIDDLKEIQIGMYNQILSAIQPVIDNNMCKVMELASFYNKQKMRSESKNKTSLYSRPLYQDVLGNQAECSNQCETRSQELPEEAEITETQHEETGHLSDLVENQIIPLSNDIYTQIKLLKEIICIDCKYSPSEVYKNYLDTLKGYLEQVADALPTNPTFLPTLDFLKNKGVLCINCELLNTRRECESCKQLGELSKAHPSSVGIKDCNVPGKDEGTSAAVVGTGVTLVGDSSSGGKEPATGSHDGVGITTTVLHDSRENSSAAVASAVSDNLSDSGMVIAEQLKQTIAIKTEASDPATTSNSLSISMTQREPDSDNHSNTMKTTGIDDINHSGAGTISVQSNTSSSSVPVGVSQQNHLEPASLFHCKATEKSVVETANMAVDDSSTKDKGVVACSGTSTRLHDGTGITPMVLHGSKGSSSGALSLPVSEFDRAEQLKQIIATKTESYDPATSTSGLCVSITEHKTLQPVLVVRSNAAKTAGFDDIVHPGAGTISVQSNSSSSSVSIGVSHKKPLNPASDVRTNAAKTVYVQPNYTDANSNKPQIGITSAAVRGSERSIPVPTCAEHSAAHQTAPESLTKRSLSATLTPGILPYDGQIAKKQKIDESATQISICAYDDSTLDDPLIWECVDSIARERENLNSQSAHHSHPELSLSQPPSCHETRTAGKQVLMHSSQPENSQRLPGILRAQDSRTSHATSRSVNFAVPQVSQQVPPTVDQSLRNYAQGSSGMMACREPSMSFGIHNSSQFSGPSSYRQTSTAAIFSTDFRERALSSSYLNRSPNPCQRTSQHTMYHAQSSAQNSYSPRFFSQQRYSPPRTVGHVSAPYQFDERIGDGVYSYRQNLNDPFTPSSSRNSQLHYSHLSQQNNTTCNQQFNSSQCSGSRNPQSNGATINLDGPLANNAQHHYVNGEENRPCLIVRESNEAEVRVMEWMINYTPSKIGRSPPIIEVRKRYATHRNFGLSMQVGGTIHEYVMDVFGATIMQEQYDRTIFTDYRRPIWKKFVMFKDAVNKFREPAADPEVLKKYISEPAVPCRLHNYDAVYAPIKQGEWWILVVANFTKRRFETYCPYYTTDGVQEVADTFIENFRLAYEAAYHSFPFSIVTMEIRPVQIVSDNASDRDTAIHVMTMMLSHDGDFQYFIRANNTKKLREQLVYYMLTFPGNTKMNPAVMDIKRLYGNMAV